jgi:hypothetical protein
MPKLRLEDRLQKCFDRALNDAIFDRGNAQGPELPRFTGFGDKLAPRRAGSICAGAQFGLKPFEEALLTDPIPDAAHGHPVDPSRVGRDSTRPGLVVTLLNIHKPRDRSHYERFPTYHKSFYRSVEATSVTPLSPRAMDRGLPAVAVALARLGISALTPMLAAKDVESHDAETRRIASAVGERAQNHADGLPTGFGDHVRNRVKSLIDDWAQLAHGAGQGGVAFGYARGRNNGVSTPLLREMIDPDRATLTDTQLRFRAPRSLRDVEPSVLLGIKTPEGTDIT